jgi:hypothetical protein
VNKAGSESCLLTVSGFNDVETLCSVTIVIVLGMCYGKTITSVQ